MNRKAGIALIAAVLVLSSSQVISAAPIKTGSSCSKAGKIAVAKEKKYTCIKKGKKLTRSKGVRIKSAAPAPTPTVSISATQHLSHHPLLVLLQHLNHHPLPVSLRLHPPHLNHHLRQQLLHLRQKTFQIYMRIEQEFLNQHGVSHQRLLKLARQSMEL